MEDFITDFPGWLMQNGAKQPWELINELENVIVRRIGELSAEYTVTGTIAIHRSAIVEQGVVFKGAIIISEQVFIGANAYLRGPVFLGNAVRIGPSSEIKQSVILDGSVTAHFNYIGNSIIGRAINFEAGAICANHYNERQDKRIFVRYKDQVIDTQSEKFGALVGDQSRVGANAVLSPGTILPKNSIVKRLELVEQVNDQREPVG